MRRLALLRHAKSSWDDPTLADRERPLARRGRRAAPLMGIHMNGIGLAPDLVLCSPARRTRETWDLVRSKLVARPPVRIESTLYGGEDEAILGLLRKMPDSVGTLLVIGHNPSLEDLAATLAGEAESDDDKTHMREKFPTTALAVIDFEQASWADLKQGGGRLSHFMTPRALENSTE